MLQAQTARANAHARQLAARRDRSARLREILGVGASDGGEVHDARRGGVKRGEAPDVRLEPLEGARLEDAHARNAGGAGPVLELPQPRQLGGAARHDQLARALMGDLAQYSVSAAARAVALPVIRS